MNSPSVQRKDISKARRDLILNEITTKNSLSSTMVDSLLFELECAEIDAIQMVVLRSDTDVFSSGFDLSTLDQETDATILMRLSRIGILLESLSNAPFMTIAAMDGPAVGAGADLALACDQRIGTSNTSFRFPGAAFGIVLGTQRLSALVGEARALQLVSSGSKLNANDAEQFGLMTIEKNVSDVMAVLEKTSEHLGRLPRPTLSQLIAAARIPNSGEQLAALVRSIAGFPGIKNRIIDFRSKTKVGVK